ncbi:hypothetical protein C0J45_7134 [Silurus meridionalis]|uniref:ribonuclease H n=1 Tax=Silurus meridionalis TaxID=175797 RepID=A0A8T0BJP7_SILME|nr:hypothetical protein HF521_020896 [Silurus meridionalis]KAI5103553.1 hypothetical protein C0J45_7134 [Silurus meridionalis]
MKLWERVVEAKLREEVTICEQQFGFMPRKSTTDAFFALRMLIEKYREGRKELPCVFVDLEKAYDRVPREELWYCMRKSVVSDKYVKVVQDMYEDSVTAVKCAVGTADWFRVKVGLHQGLALSPFLFAVVMDRLTDEVRQESPWTMMFGDDIVICGESREQVEKRLERWSLGACLGGSRGSQLLAFLAMWLCAPGERSPRRVLSYAALSCFRKVAPEDVGLADLAGGTETDESSPASPAESSICSPQGSTPLVVSFPGASTGKQRTPSELDECFLHPNHSLHARAYHSTPTSTPRCDQAPAPKKAKAAHTQSTMSWKDQTDNDTVPQTLQILPAREPGPQLRSSDSHSPLSLFKMSTLCHNTNAQAAKSIAKGRKYKWRDVTVGEMYRYIGLLFYMAMVKLPSIIDYRRQSSIFTIPFPATIMSRDRYRTISWNVHRSHPDADKENDRKRGTSEHDRLFRVKPLMDTIHEGDLPPPRRPPRVHGAPPAALGGSATSLKRLVPLRDFLAAWKDLPEVSRWVLHTIEKGYLIHFGSSPPRFNRMCSNLVGPKQALVLAQEVCTLLWQGAIEVVPFLSQRVRLYSQYFVVPKKDGGLRLILDLRSLNRSLMRLSVGLDRVAGTIVSHPDRSYPHGGQESKIPLGLLHMRPLKWWFRDRGFSRKGNPLHVIKVLRRALRALEIWKEPTFLSHSCPIFLEFPPGMASAFLYPKLGYVPKMPTAPS